MAKGQNPWQVIEAGAAEFISGAPVKIEIDTKGSPVTFTAKNEFGTEYTFNVNGAITVHGAPS